MRRKARDWKKNDPVRYFYEHYSHVQKRKQLQKEDCGLYGILRKTGKLDEVLPDTHYMGWTEQELVKFFNENFSHLKTRIQLTNEDYGLYNKLKKAGKLDEVLPVKQRKNWSKINPVQYFHDHYQHIKSIRQLCEENGRLYDLLRKIGKLEEVLPGKKRCRNWKNVDPVKYFHEHYSHLKNREQLLRMDSGLYGALHRIGKLDELLPKKTRDWAKIDPVEYFKQQYPHVKTRVQLRREDYGLCCVLYRTGKIDEVLPSIGQLQKQALETTIRRYVG